MIAAVLTGHGGPEMLEVRDDVAVPRPGQGEVLVEVAAAAVNNTDIWTREGAYGAPEDPDAVAGWRGRPWTFHGSRAPTSWGSSSGSGPMWTATWWDDGC